jgi:hypothetical protein
MEMVRILLPCLLKYRNRVSSGSIVSDYGLDDRAIGVRFQAGAKDFSSSVCVQTDSGAHPASCTMGTGGPFPGVKRGRGVTLTTHPHLVPSSRMNRAIFLSPQAPPWRVAGLLCFALLRYMYSTMHCGLTQLLSNSRRKM